MGKAHASIFNFLDELQNEQADTESMLTKLPLEETIKKTRAPRIKLVKDRLFDIVAHYYTKPAEESNTFAQLDRI